MIPPSGSYHLDLHSHSRFAYATARTLTLPVIEAIAAEKGVAVMGTGDVTHPAWRAELAEQLVPAPEQGLLVRRGSPPHAPRFLASAEVACSYRQGGRTRRLHVLVALPSLGVADALAAALERRGAVLGSDGRPSLAISARDVAEIALEADPSALVIPAHAWTPWFGVLGSKSGFDSLQECFDDLTGHVLAVETGLSADPAMCWRVGALDDVALISSSDAHGPRRIARETTVLSGEVSYPGIREALRTGAPSRAGERAASPTQLVGTVELPPQEGKYHHDGHRAHDVSMTPAQRAAAGGRCRMCGRPVTVGVLSRVEELADHPEGTRPAGAPGFTTLVPLDEVLADALGVRPAARRVATARAQLLTAFGSELDVLTSAPVGDVAALVGERAGEALRRVRAGEVDVEPGYDGRYGVVRILDPAS